MFTVSQINKLAEVVRSGNPFIIKPTKRQSGGFLGTLLASIDVSLLLKTLIGDGLQGYSRYQPPPPLPQLKSDGNDIEVRA